MNSLERPHTNLSRRVSSRASALNLQRAAKLLRSATKYATDSESPCRRHPNLYHSATTEDFG